MGHINYCFNRKETIYKVPVYFGFNLPENKWAL